MFEVNVMPSRPQGRVSWFRCAAVMLLMAGLVFGIAGRAEPAGAWSDGWIATDVLNLREEPGTWAGILDQMWDGEYVGVLDGPTDDGWYLVEYQGTRGWAFGSYLSVNGSLGWGGGAPSSSSGGERWVDVNRSTGKVILYEGSTAIESYYASLGWDTSSSGFYSTAIGTYYVYSKYAGISWTDWGQVYIKYWVGFDPGRYNGFHSYSLDSAGNVLPNGDGATGGCVALPLWAAEIVYNWLSIGSRVEVHW
ncbi:MAG: SH3 domain-containing protein [Thermomicrobiales bacterium]|nr:SH3 domain-containing protein [Thermomicrobiales bacterium]